jgi:hypothetical protein
MVHRYEITLTFNCDEDTKVEDLIDDILIGPMAGTNAAASYAVVETYVDND